MGSRSLAATFLSTGESSGCFLRNRTVAPFTLRLLKSPLQPDPVQTFHRKSVLIRISEIVQDRRPSGTPLPDCMRCGTTELPLVACQGDRTT